MGLLILYVAVAIGISFFCSLLEAVLLSVRRSALIEARDAGSKGAERMLYYKGEGLDDAIGAILTLNTISHTIGAALAGAQAATVAKAEGYGDNETMVVGIFSAVLTVLVLVFSEIVPKTLGAVYAPTLALPVGRILQALVFISKPLLLFTSALTKLITRKERSRLSRSEVRAFISMAQGEGALEAEEERWHANLLALEELRVSEVLTPRTVVKMLPADDTYGDLLAAQDAEPFSRIPLYQGARDNVVGYVYQRDVLRALARGEASDTPLRSIARDVHFIPETASIRTALRELLDRNAHFAMAVDEHGGVDGLVSLEDLTETLFGTELVDETDRDVDMRAVALQLRERRLKRAGLDPA
ncbi:MAG: CNNM domain-containing protein [Planctomycetota bacterium]